MKKIIISALACLAIFISSSAMGGVQKDEKALESATKKTNELKSSLNLNTDQQKQVLQILYSAYSGIRATHDQQNLSKEQKIVQYNDINTRTHNDLKKVLTDGQYRIYNSPGRGQ